MSRIHKAGAAVAHILIVSLSIHVYHFVTSDRMLDAAADVGLDKIATVTLHAIHVSAE
jgi:hypothetical protein